MDWIHLRHIRFRCILGVYPHEQETERDVVVEVSLGMDMTAAARSDELRDALNYEQVEEACIRVAQEGRFRLLEALADALAAACLAFPGVQEVRLTVDKPGALPHTDSVAVEVCRRRADATR